MANQKILTLGFKINIDAAGKAKLDNLTKGIDKGLDSANTKTTKLNELTATRLAILKEQEALNSTVTKYIDAQNAALAKNVGYQNLIEGNLSRAEQKYTKINESLYRQLSQLKEISNYVSKNPAAQATASTGWDSAANQAKVKAGNDARKKELEDRETFFVSMETRLSDKLKDITKFRVDANADWERKQSKAVVDEKIAMYTSLWDKIDARNAKAAAFTSKMASGTAGSAMIGGMTAAAKASVLPTASINSTPILTNTDALSKNKVAADAAAKTHTNLFLRVGEAIGAYRVWNTTLMYTKEALMAIPKAGIELQSTKAALFGIFGSEQGAKNMQFLSELANNAGQSLLGLEQAYRRYAPSAILAGATQDEINKSFKEFAEVGTILHLPEDKLNSLFLALDQMFAKGVVQSEEIKKQLGNVLPGAVEVGAKAMGKTPAVFMDMMSKNLVTAKEFIPKFSAIYRETFGGVDDSVFNDIRTKLLSNLYRVQNEYLNINRAIFSNVEGMLNEVVKGAANALTAIKENLTGIGQALEIFAGLVVGRIAISIVALVSNLSLLASTLSRVGVAMAALTGLSNPVVLAITAITAVGVSLFASLNNLAIGYDKASGFVIKFKEDQVSLTSYIEAAAIVSVEKLKSAFEGLFNFKLSAGTESFLSMQLEALMHPIDTVKTAVFQLMSAFEALKASGGGKSAMLEAYNASMAELQSSTSKVNDEIIKLAKTRDEAKKGKEEPIIPPTPLTPSGENPQVVNAAAAAKALKDSYKDIARETKLATEETNTLLDQLASKYADNLVSIKDYYAKRVELQLANVEVEKTIQEKMIARASAAGDTATIEKAKDQIELLNEKAKQFQPIADKERTNDLRTYNNTLANTTAQYLELTGATVAATKARLELQNAPLKQQLQTQINDVKSTEPEKTKAKEVLGQVAAGEEIAKIHAAAEAAKSYRDSINEISQSYMQMGATSADVMNTTLGGFSPMINMISNFQTEQAKVLATMADLQAKSAELAAVKIEILKAPDTEATRAALEQNTKDTELNVKQRDALEAESNMSKVKAITNTFALGENLAEKGSKTQKLLHKATVAMQVVEMAMTIKAGVTYVATKLTEMAASASATGVKMGEAAATLVAESGWAGFAGIAALAAIVAGFAASGGGSSTTTTNTSQPESSPTGTVFGDKTAISTSLEDTLSLLTDINYKSYNELVKMNFYSNKTSVAIVDLNKVIASGKLMAPSLSTNAVGRYVNPFLGTTTTITKVDEGIQTLGNSMKNILTGAKAQVAQYTTLEKTTETLFSTSKSVYDVLQKATTQSVDAFTAIFRNIGNTILNMANKVGETALVALYKYKFSSLKISLMGKQGEDLTKKLTGLVNKELDKVAMAVFGSMFKGLRDLKEGMFATVSRLFIQKEVVKGYFKDLGASFTVNAEEGTLFADALVRVSSNAATGAERLKEFAKQQEDFFNNFATTLMKNNKTVADFAQGLSSVFNQGLSVDQVSKTKAFVDYNKARADLDNAMIKSSKLQRLEANLAKAKTPIAIRNAEKALLPLETTYNTQVAIAQENLTKAAKNYNVGLNGSIEAYQTLKDVFFNTVATTGNFGAALIEVKKNLDLSTESGKAAFVMLNNLSNEFTKLVEGITQPIKNQITSIADSIDATSKEDLLKQLAASREFETQKTISVRIQKLIIDKYNTEKTAINNIKNSFINLSNTVKTLLGGDLSTKNPYEKLQLAQTEYTDLLAKSRSTDLTVASDAASKLGASAQAYLTEAKSYFGATAQYADIFNSVTTTLSGLSQTAESAADASTAQLEALGRAAIDELDNLASISTQAILDTLKEGIKALDITDTTKIATDQLLLLAMKADNLGIAFDTLIAKFNQEMSTPASNAGSGIQALMDQLTAARLAGDTKEMVKINKQIDAYNRGFNKGGAIVGATYAANRLEYLNNQEAIAQLNKDKLVKGADKAAIDIQIKDIQERNKLIVKAGAYADGGRVSTGMSLVGERGPELIRLPVGTNVIKNSTTNRLLEDSNKQTINILSDMRKELIILNDRMGTIERKTRLTKPTLSMA